MGNKLRRADDALWTGVDALTLVLLVYMPVLTFVFGVGYLVYVALTG